MNSNFISMFIVLFFAGIVTQARSPEKFVGFVPVRADLELYVEYTKPKAGMPTVVLLNGLTYSTVQWARMVQPLIDLGVGVVAYDFEGMGKTLLKYAPILKKIPYQQQVQDLDVLLTNLQIPGPYNIAGLSYGGGIGIHYAKMFPEKVRNLILMAPFTQPLESQDQWIRGQIWATKQMFPFNPATDDELYDYFLRQIIYATYPQAEPIVLENPYKLESTVRLVQGIRQYLAVNDVADLPKGSVHLMVAALDEYIPRQLMTDFWNALPENVRASRLLMTSTKHKIPESQPVFAAAWLMQILMQNPALRHGVSFEGFPITGEAKSGNETIHLYSERNAITALQCHSILL